MDLGIEGKSALVTGAASKKGIGYAISLALAREGVNIAAADIDFEGVESLAQTIEGMGRKAFPIKINQGVYSEVKEGVSEILEALGQIDILINCAAITSNMGLLSKMATSAWENEINVNLTGPYYWMRELIPPMVKRGWGRVINIASTGGIIGSMGLPSYCASKGGLIALTREAALETASRGVTVNTLALGIIKTGIYERGNMDSKVLDSITRRIPLRRMGEPAEAADVAVFLASENARYITGSTLIVDGAHSLNAFLP